MPKRQLLTNDGQRAKEGVTRMYSFFKDVAKLTGTAVGASLVTKGLYSSTLYTAGLVHDKYDSLAKQSPIFKITPTALAASQSIDSEPVETNKHKL